MTAASLPLPPVLLLTSEQAACYCGVSVKTFRAHIKVRAIKIGSSVRFDRRDLDQWAANQNQSRPLTDDEWLAKLDEPR